MSDSVSNLIWCQLYLRGEYGECSPDGQKFAIYSFIDSPLPINIDQLKERVKEKIKLNHCQVNRIFVYPPGTELDMTNEPEAIEPDTSITELLEVLTNDNLSPTSGKHPLIVVVPRAPLQPAQSGLLSQVVSKVKVMSQQLKQIVDEESTLQLSKPSVEKFDNAMKKIGCKRDTPNWDQDEDTRRTIASLNESMVDFEWESLKEDSKANHENYMAYLNNSITLPVDSKLFDGTGTQNLLSTKMESVEVKTCGNIGVVMAHRRHQDVSIAISHMWAGIELKKANNTDNEGIRRQVILQHLSASHLNRSERVLTIMTDLGRRWHFYWFSKLKNALMIYKATSKGEANYLISHMMKKTGTTSAPPDFLNRSTWNEMFPSSSSCMDTIAEGGIGNGRGGNDRGGDNDEDHNSSEKYDRQNKKHRPNTNGQAQSSRGSSSVGGTGHATTLSLDFMDEEEEREATFRAVLDCLLPQYGFPPQMAQIDRHAEGPPTHIGVQ